MVIFVLPSTGSNKTSITENIIGQLLIASCLVLFYYAFTMKLYFLVALPVLLFGVVYLLFKPDHIIYLFFISHFLSVPLLRRMSFVVSVPEIMYYVMVMSFICSPHFLKTVAKFRYPESPVFNRLLLLFMFGIVSWILNLSNLKSEFILSGAWYLLRYTQLFIVFYIFTNLNISRKTIEQYVYIVAILMASELLICILQFYLNIGEGYASARNTVHGTFGYNHAMIGTYSIVPLCFALYRYIIAKTTNEKLIAIGLSVAVFAVIIMSGARSSLLGVICAGCLYTVMSFKFKKIYFVYLVSMMFLFVLLYFLTPLSRIIDQTFFSQETHTLDVSSASRFIIWLGAIKHFINAEIITKLFGVGIGSYYTIDYDIAIWGGARGINGAHNIYLHVLCEVGILGLLAFCWLFGTILRELHKKGKYDPLAQMYFFATVALLASGLAQETFWFQGSLGSVWLFYIFFLTLILKKEQRITE